MSPSSSTSLFVPCSSIPPASPISWAQLSHSTFELIASCNLCFASFNVIHSRWWSSTFKLSFDQLVNVVEAAVSTWHEEYSGGRRWNAGKVDRVHGNADNSGERRWHRGVEMRTKMARASQAEDGDGTRESGWGRRRQGWHGGCTGGERQGRIKSGKRQGSEARERISARKWGFPPKKRFQRQNLRSTERAFKIIYPLPSAHYLYFILNNQS